MDKIKDIHIMVLIVFLMIMRLFVAGKWFGCIVLAGLLVAIFDLINKLYKSNLKLVSNRQKIRYGICFIILNVFFFIGCVLIALNIILEMQWLSEATFLDEITLFTLLLTLPQNLIIEHINQIIQK
jgi:hypothetical protein